MEFAVCYDNVRLTEIHIALTILKPYGGLMNMKKFLLGLGTAVLALGVLAACGETPADEEAPVEEAPIGEEAPIEEDADLGAEEPADDLEDAEGDLEEPVEDDVDLGEEEEEEAQG